MPTIGVMFLAILFTGNSLYASLAMEMASVYRFMEGFESFVWFIVLYPAFSVGYIKAKDVAFMFSVMEGLRHLGDFLSMSRWPAQMFCADPMACWRSHYLYSHALFYNSNGDSGNINYVNWYLCCKSQNRQCCCPYRKLKPDAPQKCCNPCCLGPFVEETGGCPCPCCCSSCSS